MIKLGGVIIDNMGLLFVVGVVFGFFKDKYGFVVFLGLVGYYVVIILFFFVSVV